MFTHNPNITARKASAMLKTELNRRNIPYKAVKAKTVSFSDLLRDSAVFAVILGWVGCAGFDKATLVTELKQFSHSNGFHLDFRSGDNW